MLLVSDEMLRKSDNMLLVSDTMLLENMLTQRHLEVRGAVLEVRVEVVLLRCSERNRVKQREEVSFK